MPSFRGTQPAPRPAPVQPIPPAARVAGLAAALIGASGVFGWLLHLPEVRRIHPSLPEMQPNTALAIVACGLVLALPARARNLARALAAFSLAIGVVTMVEYGTGRDLGIDNAIIEGTRRMAPQTSISLAMLGLALLARWTPGRERLAQPLAVLPAALCYLSLVGLLFNAEMPIFPLATTMALHTAAAILILGFGLVVAQPERGLLERWMSAGPGGRTLRLLLPAFVVLPPLLAFASKAGELAGAYDEGFGIALEATVMMLLLTAGVLRHSRTLDAGAEEREREVERFRRILENVPEGVAIIDLCGQVQYANARMSLLLGRAATPGLSLTECVEPRVRGVFHGFLRHAEREAARATVAVRGEDGSLRSLRFSATPLPDPLSSGGHGTLVLVIDDTSRRVAESRLRERAHQLEGALRDIDAFATIASHDLREPLRKIQLLADAATHEGASPATADALLRIRRSAALLQERVADLLTYSRLGVPSCAMAPVDLAAVVREVEERLADRIRDAGGSVVVGVLPTIDGDAGLLRELFLQLFDNALKFRRPGVPPAIRVASAPRTGGRVDITVADNGLGLDTADARHIFDVFRTLHARELYTGSGVGLAICRRIAEIHGGEISARGTPGEGSVFTLSLPVRAPLGVPSECVPAEAP